MRYVHRCAELRSAAIPCHWILQTKSELRTFLTHPVQSSRWSYIDKLWCHYSASVRFSSHRKDAPVFGNRTGICTNLDEVVMLIVRIHQQGIRLVSSKAEYHRLRQWVPFRVFIAEEAMLQIMETDFSIVVDVCKKERQTLLFYRNVGKTVRNTIDPYSHRNVPRHGYADSCRCTGMHDARNRRRIPRPACNGFHRIGFDSRCEYR